MDDAEVAELAKMCSADILDTRGRMLILGAKNRGKELPVQKTQKKPTIRARAKFMRK